MKSEAHAFQVAAIALALAFSPVAQAGPWRASRDNTAGWDLMSPAERIEHQRRIRGVRTYGACVAYEQWHERRVSERAGARSGQSYAQPRYSGCAQLKARGMID
jgi:hypothetical protein